MRSSVFPLAIFFLSGFAALLYQVVWQRLLAIFSGADVYSITVIVSAFMAGLGIGNLTGGHLADRLTPRQNLWLFAIAEFCIGAFGLFSKALYYDLLYLRWAFLSASALSGLVLFVSLLWPTFFMGLSLPVLARALTPRLAAAGRVIASLYGWNTLGAAAGALATTWLLLPRVGLAGALPIGAALNVACAVAAVAFIRVTSNGRALAAEAEAGPTGIPEPVTDRLPFWAWMLVYALTGFTALALEIVWFRLLGVMLKSTAFTFGTLLAVYLLGLGGGAAIGARVVNATRNPGRTFLGLQTALIVLSGVSIAVLVRLLAEGWPPLLAEHLSRNEYDIRAAARAVSEIVRGGGGAAALGTAAEFMALFGLLPIALIGLPTLLMGYSFPFLQKAVQADYARLGRRVGMLMTANIAGSAAGAVLTGLVLLASLGTASTLKAVVALAVIPGLLWLRLVRGRGARVAAAALLAIAIAGAVVSIPGRERLWAALHGSALRPVIVEEDGAGVTLLKASPAGFEQQTLVFVNGLSQSWIPFGDIHTVLGALPLVIHPEPREIAIIGLGSGDTAFSAAGRAETQRVACIEIIGGQRRALQRLITSFPYAGLTAMVSDSRVEHVVGDGRAFILQQGRQFDIIEADALRPGTAYSGNLYSREYFELLQRHLRPRGLAVTWAPTPRVARTFASVFPYVVAMKSIYVGSNEPIALDRDAIAARMRAPGFVDYYGRAGIDIVPLLDDYLRGDLRVLTPGDERVVDDVNSDVFPRDEFNLPRVLPF